MKVLLVTVGSRGDVQPMLVLARALSSRGHEVRLAAPPNFESVAFAESLPFVPIGADAQVVLDENRHLAERNPILALPAQIALLKREIAQQVTDLFRETHGADLVVGAGLAFGAPLLADKLDAAYAYVCYTVAGIRSKKHPPATIPIFGLPEWGNQTLWWAITHTFDWTVGRVLRAGRLREGLGADPVPWRTIHASETLLAQDELLGALPADALGCRVQVPALVYDEGRRRPLPREVEQFLAGSLHGDGDRGTQKEGRDGEATSCIYVGFGSMPTVNRERLVSCVVELNRATGARVLLSLGHGPTVSQELPPGILTVEGLDHASLFPRMSLVVHHGGAGTTATALRAGAPQLVVPHIVDQFFHGNRIADLGLGMAPVPKAKLSPAHLIASFEARASHRDKARAVAAGLVGKSGAVAAVDYLEALVAARAARSA